MTDHWRELLDAALLDPTAAAVMIRTDPQCLQLRDSCGETVLHFLCIEGEVGAVHVLLRHGADPNQPDVCGQTPLMSAARLGHNEVVRLLLQFGADVNSCDDNRDTALHSDVAIEMLGLLLERGADPNVKGGFASAAHVAAQKAHINPGLLKLLLEHGCDLQARDASRASVASYLDPALRRSSGQPLLREALNCSPNCRAALPEARTREHP